MKEGIERRIASERPAKKEEKAGCGSFVDRPVFSFSKKEGFRFDQVHCRHGSKYRVAVASIASLLGFVSCEQAAAQPSDPTNEPLLPNPVLQTPLIQPCSHP